MITLICNCPVIPSEDWMTLFKTFMPIIITTIVAVVAYQQYRVNRRKLRLDLYDKRYAVFQCLIDMLKDIYKNKGIDNDKVFNTYEKVQQAKYLFNKKIETAFATIILKNEELFNLKTKDQGITKEFLDNLLKGDEIIKELEIQRQYIEKKLIKYLSFRKAL